MTTIKLWTAFLLAAVARASAVQLNMSTFQTQMHTSYADGVAYTVEGGSVTGGVESSLTRLHGDPPGEDADPEGVVIYDTLDAVPTARMLARGIRQSKCFRETGCWRPYVCGHRCEQILLAVDGFCKRNSGCSSETSATCGEWRRCKKARKFHRCFARVCYRGGIGGRPGGYEDATMVAIVRYRRPLPRHEVLAKKNRQSSTQSAIFK